MFVRFRNVLRDSRRPMNKAQSWREGIEPRWYNSPAVPLSVGFARPVRPLITVDGCRRGSRREWISQYSVCSLSSVFHSLFVTVIERDVHTVHSWHLPKTIPHHRLTQLSPSTDPAEYQLNLLTSSGTMLLTRRTHPSCATPKYVDSFLSVDEW